MDLNWLQSLLFGLVSGLTDILPVSAQAHRMLMFKFFGVKSAGNLLTLLLHLSVLAALYLSSRGQFVKINRARALARVPKRKRKRPLDVRSMMDWSLIKTMLVPTILGLFLYQWARNIQTSFHHHRPMLHEGQYQTPPLQSQTSHLVFQTCWLHCSTIYSKHYCLSFQRRKILLKDPT